MAKKIDSKSIAVSGILIALSVVWTWLVPTIDLGMYWSFTPFSHIFIFIAMFISPIVGGFTALGTLLGFFLKGANYVLLMRAASHLIFVAIGLLLLKKLNVRKPLHFIIYALSLALIHAAMETSSVYLAIAFGLPIPENTALYLWGATFGGTIIHSLIDCTAAYFVSKLLTHSNVIKMPPLLKAAD